MSIQDIFLYTLLVLLSSCQLGKNTSESGDIPKVRFEKINYFKYPLIDSSQNPFQYRVTYYLDNGLPHRWIELDSLNNTLTDYIYKYDSNWIQTGAIYREDSNENYSKEVVSFSNDTTRTTEWLDSSESVYYTMIDNLNDFGKTYRATFIGDKIHGYDSTFYTNENFEKRIFFTNTKGKVMNDRSFHYDSTNDYGDWIQRKKIMNDTIREIHKREVYYDNHFTSKNNQFYEGIISSGEWEENVINFSKNENVVFFTRTRDWIHQKGFLSTKVNGLFTPSKLVNELDSIYNGAISPHGNRIIYSRRNEEKEEIWISEIKDGVWTDGFNLTATSNIQGGYFNWFNNEELYFYIPNNNGDIVQGKLKDNLLSIVDSLSILNTVKGTEFSPYLDKENRFIIFTRYVEGNELQQGFFVSYNNRSFDQPRWSTPEKIKTLPYGWSAYVTGNYDDFIYTDGNNIYCVPFNNLNLKIEK